MKHLSLEIASGANILSQAMRAIRKKRGMTASEVAAAMEMPLRTFEEFEAGRGPLTHDRIFAFADATDSDPFALILSTSFGSPTFAVDCADTKLAMIMMMHLEEFAEREGSDIAYLEPPNLIGGFERLFKEFGAKLQDREAFLRNWLDNRTGSIGLAALRLRGVKRSQRKDG